MDYNLQELFFQVFGITVTDAYQLPGAEERPNDPNGIYDGINFTQNLPEAEKMSHLGTPVLFPITFLAGTYKKYNEFGSLVDYQMPDFVLPYSCVIDFRRPKLIARTHMSSGYGSVKEIFGFDDWQINIKGFFIPQPNHPNGFISPYDQEKALNSWNELSCSIDVANELFQKREIHSLTIEDFVVEGQRGQPNVRPFTLRTTSDIPILLELQENKYGIDNDL